MKEGISRIAIIDSELSLGRCRRGGFEAIYAYADGVPGSKGVRSLVADLGLESYEYRTLARDLSLGIERQVLELIDASSRVSGMDAEVYMALLKKVFAFSMGKGLGRSIEKLSIAMYAGMHGIEVVFFEDILLQRAIGVSRVIDAMQPCKAWLDRYCLSNMVLQLGVLARIGRTFVGAVFSFAASLLRKRMSPSVIALSHATQAEREILKYLANCGGNEGRLGLIGYSRLEGRIRLFTFVSRADGLRLLIQACRFMVAQLFSAAGLQLNSIRGPIRTFLYKEIIPFNVGAGLYIRVFEQYLQSLARDEQVTLLVGDDDIWASGFVSVLDKAEGLHRQSVLVSHGWMSAEHLRAAEGRYTRVVAAVEDMASAGILAASVKLAVLPIERIVVVLPRFHVCLFTALLDGLYRRRADLERRGIDVRVHLHPSTPWVTKLMYYLKYPENLSDRRKVQNDSLANAAVFSYRSKFLEIHNDEIFHLVLLNIYQNESILDHEEHLPCDLPADFCMVATVNDIESTLDALVGEGEICSPAIERA